ncbi:BppU family phage baseplate upper protein [Halobacillus sp. BBL2006]|uniref:BppU family phage baseplate upper protein n=1 Tax=Halobacillus sp. BBL2006 TaxID=1543706 RepID=UPI000541CB58|nr:BppU family phage baseplate upper protein [Halobacillus sp. BBL2006]KHE73150.1 hypothetical protein LD39_00730 [Halobacillus sp. BBL2006]
MQTILRFRQGDTRDAIKAVLKKDGNPVNLTGKTVLFYMSNGVEGYAEVIDAAAGVVMYPVEESMTTEEGVFYAEFKVVHEDGRKSTYPNNGFIPIRVIKGVK